MLKEVWLYDLSSSYFDATCPLAAFGHNRDGKKGKRRDFQDLGLKTFSYRGMITQNRVRLMGPCNLFDERNLFTLTTELCGERLVACRNPELARRRRVAACWRPRPRHWTRCVGWSSAGACRTKIRSACG